MYLTHHTELDMEHEEERGRGSEEAAKDQRGPDPCAERCVFYGVTASVYTQICYHWSATLDLTELDLPPTMKTIFPDPADLLNFTLTITPDEGASGSLYSCALRISCSYSDRYVQGGRVCFLLRDQQQLST